MQLDVTSTDAAVRSKAIEEFKKSRFADFHCPCCGDCGNWKEGELAALVGVKIDPGESYTSYSVPWGEQVSDVVLPFTCAECGYTAIFSTKAMSFKKE